MVPPSPEPVPAAVVFDFDGLILDTETPIFEAASAALTSLGHGITVEAWAGIVGLGDGESFAALCRVVGAEVDRRAYDAAYAAQDRTWRDHLLPLPGVVDLLDALAAADVPCGVASSSSVDWVEGHLVRLGLRQRFATLATADRVGGRTKPAPDSYLLACADLGVDPAAAVALEDSAHGIAAARAAGLSVVAVPSAITRHTDLSGAHHQVPSLEHLTPAGLGALAEARSARA